MEAEPLPAPNLGDGSHEPAGEPGAAQPADAAEAAGDLAAGDAAAAGEHGTEIDIGPLDVLCVGPIVLLSIYGFAGSPIAPQLISSHPLLLSFLRGSTAAIINTGSFARVGRVPLWAALVAPLLILVAADPFFYWAGRRYGRLVIDYYRKQGRVWDRRIAQGERFFARWGAWAILGAAFLPLAPFLFVAAGEARTAIWKVAIADLISNLAYTGLLVGLGWSLGQSGVDVADAISHYGLILTIALVVLVVAYTARQVRNAMREPLDQVP